MLRYCVGLGRSSSYFHSHPGWTCFAFTRSSAEYASQWKFKAPSARATSGSAPSDSAASSPSAPASGRGRTCGSRWWPRRGWRLQQGSGVVVRWERWTCGRRWAPAARVMSKTGQQRWRRPAGLNSKQLFNFADFKVRNWGHNEDSSKLGNFSQHAKNNSLNP